MSYTIVIADDHRMVREGFRKILESFADVVVVGEAENGQNAIDLSMNLRPDIVFMDINMPDITGVEATKKICARCPKTKIIAMSVYDEPGYITGMIQAGARGYLHKNCSRSEIENAIHAVVEDRTYLGASSTEVLLRDSYKLAEDRIPAPHRGLSSRERDVLCYYAQGYSTLEIAGKMKLSIKTIDVHRKKLLEKIGVENIPGLVKYAIREGLVLENGALTPREIEIVRYIMDGKSTNTIAELLHVSPKTILTHRMNIMKKLDLKNLAELTRYALRSGLTSL